MSLLRSGSITLPSNGADSKSAAKSTDLSYQAMTVAAIVLFFASMWVF